MMIKKLTRSASACCFTAVLVTMPAVGLAQVRAPEDEERSFSGYRIRDEVREKVSELGEERVEQFRIPILMGVSLGDFPDSWGDARSDGRSHEGTDISAPQGAFIVSPMNAVVARIGVGTNGGLYVYTYNPGGERFYYAHLDAYAEGLHEGQVLQMGDLIGYVGNTGNASGGPPHLHLGIYDRGAHNPFPRMTLEFSDEERAAALSRIIANATNTDVMAAKVHALYRDFLSRAITNGIDVPEVISRTLVSERLSSTMSRDLTLGSRGEDVVVLQQFLIQTNTGPEARALAEAGATGYFGVVTASALAEFQSNAGIVPSTGYFGPLTRATLRGDRSSLAPTANTLPTISRDLEFGATGDEVTALQKYLIEANRGMAAQLLRTAGATGYFGQITRDALAEFQRTAGIRPAEGYFGPLTRAYIAR